jgi:hypothetical protein
MFSEAMCLHTEANLSDGQRFVFQIVPGATAKIFLYRFNPFSAKIESIICTSCFEG